jgi:hypothetical protein
MNKQTITNEVAIGRPATAKRTYLKLVRLFKTNAFVYIMLLFIVSRTLYVCVGDASIRLFDRRVPSATTGYTTKISRYTPVQMWYIWDASHYTDLAHQYSTSLKQLPIESQRDGKTGYYLLRWFPLYPLLAKFINALTSLSIPYAQLLISNLAFVIALYLFYKLLRFDENDTFARTVLALFIILPTSFIFSAALSESLFLVLAIGSLLAARQQRWLLAGLLGFFLALTRSEGFLIAVPLLTEAIQRYGLHRDRIKQFIKPFLAAILSISGLLLFMLYCWIRTRNAWAYVDSQFVEAGVKSGDPLVYIYHSFTGLRTFTILCEILAVIVTWKKLRWSYLAYVFVFSFVTLDIGNPPAGVGSSLRYMAIIFPIAIAAGYLVRIKSLSNFIWITLGFINGAFFIVWANWWTKFIL